MASIATGRLGSGGGIVAALAGLVAADGTAAHAYPASPALRTGAHAAPNLADAVHYLCVLHGRMPGVVDLAREREPQGEAARWLEAAAAGFGAERAVLAKLAVAAGPLPSTPGQAECEATVLGQRHALTILARSDRAGCALGAALALVLDWAAVRRMVEAAGARFGVALLAPTLPAEAEALALLATPQPARDRAILFGAQQLLAQHRGLWSLLEARAGARG